MVLEGRMLQYASAQLAQASAVLYTTERAVMSVAHTDAVTQPDSMMEINNFR